MKLLPAIDLIGGRCVRLAQGDFDRETDYSAEPEVALRDFAEGGAEEAHLVDLEGARDGAPRHHDLFLDLARNRPLIMQVAGGFRTADQVRRVLDGGVSRVVIGSLAIVDPDAFGAILAEFGPDRLTLALDVRLDDSKPMVASHGWQESSGQSLDQLLRRFPSVRHLLVTDISRDGMLTGPNLELIDSIRGAFPQIDLQASGGVADLADLTALRRTGAARVIVGKAIWERRFTIAEGVTHACG